ncbi:four and a half LIM domains protein 3 [Salmo salar]|uniref:Four and a half LIM domains protein 3 n=1 Tax=Salmo salar TaxID=8030 RepID=A0A1S3Q2D9_SALSA|nr:four and a half LIM domains protein 3 [Salmo salar]XP_014034112.1 four and a half LIM domains protein 3 [Salmo salar]XP_014034113.1 four and a half LIM domains protein 3 [Salmo salar]XP_045565799.1 four and a half LIM domains protein 3 [Salmo salar]|eukprot:XP_014034111.1 PREDICTED: four and a half LIM domains protein 3-like [Salmo salar]
MSDRFDCGECKESLYGRKYIQVEDVPHCIPCYDRLYANTCQECKELITHNARELFYEDRHYHEHCFRCFRCDRSLADEPFTSQEEALLCNDCYRNEFSSKCVACDKTIMPGSKKLEYGGSAWHEDCFVCHGCEKPIGGQSFIPDKDDYYCVPCYEGRFTPRCSHCKKVLVTGGVSYKDETWHKECLVCTGCKSPLAGQPFTSQGDTPYCVKCFSSLYTQKCASCNSPITGFGEGKYVSFQDRQWHQPCFKCSHCSVSLVGSGFFPDRDQILCGDCNNDQEDQ